MIIKMNNLYGHEDSVAYYRKNGDCFDFSWSIEYASDLTKEEANKIMEHEEFYCKQYGASSLEIVE